MISKPRKVIVNYKPEWQDAFDRIAARLRAGLGDLALRIDHIGSTSVPGLAAKDVIDIQVTVRQLDQTVADAILRLGYVQPELNARDHLPPGANDPLQWQKMFFHEPAGERRQHIHVRKAGNANQRYPLLFRDYLRCQPETCEAYARLKRMLAEHIADASMYAEVKDPAVDLIYIAAEKWARESGWQPGKSDG